MRVAYFTNQYPGGSHTFIRREIRAMEALGVTVVRFALRSINPANLVGEPDPRRGHVRFAIFTPDAGHGQFGGFVNDEDNIEAKKTRFILQAGSAEFFRCNARTLLRRPLTFISVIHEAIQMGRRSDAGVLRHLVYVVEAAVLGEWCRRETVQHLHAHFGTNSTAIAMFASRLSGIPYSFTAHGSEEFIKAPLLSLDRKLERATLAVCVSYFGRSQLMRWSVPDHWQKIAVVHCGLDSGFFEKPIPQPPPNPRLVCVGRLDENKGQLVLVAAARRLYEEGIPCEILLVGNGSMRRDVESAINQAGLQKAITITGWVSGERVTAEIESARALVLPSFTENMPVVIMEAMARGRPVISTYIGGIPELVQPGKTGWLVPGGDEIALAQAMREALTAPIAQLTQMGAAGRCHILEHHDALKEAEKLKNLLERSTERNSEKHG
jgi:colanic acid/amylovoran biosynthesis glycosyltransferase